MHWLDPLCWYCGTSLKKHRGTPAGRKQMPDDYTRDHIEPKHKGGIETVACCRKCNSDKAHLTLQEYRLIVMYRSGLIDKEMIERGFLFWGER